LSFTAAVNSLRGKINTLRDILLLHGALGAKSQFLELEKNLSEDFEVHLLNFSGHGGETTTDSTFSINLFAKDVISYLDRHEIMKLDIFGYSMGGYVGVYLAKHYPERIGRVFTIGTKFRWDEEFSAREVKMLDAEKMREKIPQFYDELAKRHMPQSLEMILQKTGEMMINFGGNNELKPEDYGSIRHEIMVGLGDRDKMVTLEETVEVYNSLPNGRLLVFPDTPHLFEQININRLVFEINNFFLV
jgi:pimeloyl-ACP methyl ester carboxylesterase